LKKSLTRKWISWPKKEETNRRAEFGMPKCEMDYSTHFAFLE
jgi:hypothetical protein